MLIDFIIYGWVFNLYSFIIILLCSVIITAINFHRNYENINDSLNVSDRYNKIINNLPKNILIKLRIRTVCSVIIPFLGVIDCMLFFYKLHISHYSITLLMEGGCNNLNKKYNIS